MIARLTVLSTKCPSFVETLSSRHMEFITRPRERRQNRFRRQVRRSAPLAREFCEFDWQVKSAVEKKINPRKLTFVGKHFDLAQAETSLNTDELNGHVLSDEWAGTCEWFCGALFELSRIPGTQRVPLQVCAAVADANLEVLKRTVTATTSSRDSHNSNGLRRQKIDPPPRWCFLLSLGAFLPIWNLISCFAVIREKCRTRSCSRWLINWLSICHIGTCWWKQIISHSSAHWVRFSWLEWGGQSSPFRWILQGLFEVLNWLKLC